MSIEAIRAAAAIQLPGVEKSVLLALAWFQGPSGCWPSNATLVRHTGFNERTVRRALRKLTASGLIKPSGKDQSGAVAWQLSYPQGGQRDPGHRVPRGSHSPLGGSHSPVREGGVTPNPNDLYINKGVSPKKGNPEGTTNGLSDHLPMAEALKKFGGKEVH